MAEHFPLRLVSSYMLAPAVRHMVFARADGQSFAFIPGQFVQIHFSLADGKLTKRSYSVATVAEGPDGGVHNIEMAVSYVDGGAATQLLSNLRENEQIEASGPYGRFCLNENDVNQRYLLVGTGTGVTPYRAMLPQIRRLIAKRGCRFVLLFGARSETELLYGDEFEAFAAATPGFDFYACFSRSARQNPRPFDRMGYVQNILTDLKPNAESDIAYLCGNPNMVDAAFTMLKDAGLPIAHIRREKYVSSK